MAGSATAPIAGAPATTKPVASVAPKVAGKVNYDILVNAGTGTQMRDAFHLAGIDLDHFCPPGASNPGVYNGVQIVDAFKAWDKANPGKIDMNTISTKMTGTQVIDAFKIMIP